MIESGLVLGGIGGFFALHSLSTFMGMSND